MQGEKKAFPLFRFVHRIAAATVLVFLAGSVCAQDQRQRECEQLFSTAVAAERRGDPIEAELRYEECRDLAQKYRLPKAEAAALHRLAVIRARNKKFSESANLFRRAIDLDSQNALILCDFAQLHADRKDFDEAEIILKNALNIEPNNPKVLYSLGTVIATQRSERQAEGLRYLKLAVGEAEAYRELARIYRSKGDLSRAEYAEQRAKLAGGQFGTKTLASTDSAETVRPPQREPHQPQTPPEIVDRVRQELVEAEMREISEARQNTATPPIARAPFIPVPVGPTTPLGTSAANPKGVFPVMTTATQSQPMGGHPTPSTTAGQQQRPPTATYPKEAFPVITTAQSQPTGGHSTPFATTEQQQGLPITPVRRLEPPPMRTAPASSSLRTIPSSLGSVSGTSPFDQNQFDPLVINHAAGHEIPGNDVSDPPAVKIASSANPRQGVPLLAPFSVEPSRQVDATSVLVLPTSNERTIRVANVNPLRQILMNRADLIDPGADTSLIAALPSYSAVGSKKILRTDPSDLLMGNVPNEVERRGSRIVALRGIEALETAEIDRDAMQPLPMRDINVLQSPSAVIARQKAPTSVPEEDRSLSANTRSEHARRYTQNEHRFHMATSPDIFSFAPASQGSHPDIHSVEVAGRPSASSTPSSVTAAPTQVPQSQDPFPVLGDQPTLAEVRRDPTPARGAPTAEPVPMANNLPKTTEPKIKPDTPTPAPAQEIAARPALAWVEPAVEPISMANNLPKATEPKVMPRTPTPAPAQEIAAKPAPVQREPIIESLPKAIESKAMPSTPIPAPARGEPVIEPLPIASNLPKATEPKAIPSTPAPTPARVAAARPQPVKEEETGFASSRRTGQEAKVSGKGSETTGFARSRR